MSRSQPDWMSAHSSLVRKRELQASDDFWSWLGYSAAGVLFLGFAQWVRDRAVARGCEHVYFLSRDGWILRQVYERIAGGPPSSYLYASRRALNVPAITSLDHASLEFLTSGATVLKAGDYLARIGIDPREHEEALRRVGFGGRDERSRGASDERLRKLFKLVESEVLTQARTERGVVLDYLRQEGVLGARRVAIVDLGWHGTLQRSLQALLDEAGAKTEVIGLYLGMLECVRATGAPRDFESYLFHLGEPRRWEDAVQACCEIWEFVHSAPHGSVLGFHYESGKVHPMLAAEELDGEERAGVEAIQRAAIEYVDDAIALGLPASVPSQLAGAPLERVILRPTYEEACRLGDVRHGETFGDIVEMQRLAPVPSPLARLGLGSAVERELSLAYWRHGYRTRAQRYPLAWLRCQLSDGRYRREPLRWSLDLARALGKRVADAAIYRRGR